MFGAPAGLSRLVGQSCCDTVGLLLIGPSESSSARRQRRGHAGAADRVRATATVGLLPARGWSPGFPSRADIAAHEQNRVITSAGLADYVDIPIQLTIGTGANRIAASAVPRISAPMAENTVSRIVVQSASKIWPRYSVKTSTWLA
jgi:hypothetical protein